MQVVLEKPFYEPGETVHGVIYLRITQQLKCDGIYLDIFGREEAGKDNIEAEEKFYEGVGGDRR